MFKSVGSLIVLRKLIKDHKFAPISNFLDRFKIFENIFDLLKLKNGGVEVVKMMKNCGKIYVRDVPSDDRMQMKLKYNLNPDDQTSPPRIFNFNRPKNEDLEKALLRITSNVSKEVNKKLHKLKKEKKNSKSHNNELGENSEKDNQNKNDRVNVEDENLLKIELYDSNEKQINGRLTNEEAWIFASYLNLGEYKFKVDFNPPAVTEITLPNVLLSNYPVFPRLSVEFTDEEKSIVKWYVEDKGPTKNLNESTNAKPKKIAKKLPENWSLISTGLIFTPKVEHVDCHLRITCQPKNDDRLGEEVQAVSKFPVMEGPDGCCPFEKRHRFTSDKTGDDRFRAFSYNILADLYADSDFSRTYLFPYCPAQYLDIDYRKQLLMKELIGYNADLLLLQEVDKKVFDLDLYPILRACELDGLMKTKLGEVAEGCATFYRRSKFRYIESYDIGLSEYLHQEDSLKSLVEKLTKNSALYEKLISRNSVLQATLLQCISNPKRFVVAATVHLYFHPRASHVRLLQTHLSVNYLQKLMVRLKEEKNIFPSLIYCGDFNAFTGSGVHEYLLGKQIPATHADWYAGGIEEFVPDLHLEHELDLINATGFPLYTNYVGGFNGCLDYIYASGLVPENVVPLPSHEDVTAFTALPNRVFPSDHLAVGCEFVWRTENEVE